MTSVILKDIRTKLNLSLTNRAPQFRLADVIRTEYPREWETMTTVPVDFLDTGFDDKFGADFYSANSAPMIE
jgi:hypothetical protein